MTTSSEWIQITEKFVLLTPSLWPNMQRHSLQDIFHASGLDHKRNGSHKTVASLAENGTVSLKLWWLILVKVDIPYFVQQVPWTEDHWKVKEVEHFLYMSAMTTKQLKLSFALFFDNQLSNYKSVPDLCEEFIPPLASTGKLVAGVRVTGFTCRFVERFKTTSDQWASTGKPGAEPQGASGKSYWRWSTDKIMYRCWIHKTVEIGQYFMTKDAE